MRISERLQVRGNQGGFTLVELLVVIAILAILVAVVVPNFTGLIGRGKTEAANAELKTIQTATDAYMADNRVSTIAGGAGTINGADVSCNPASSWATSIISAYLRGAPHGCYSYTAAGAVTQVNYP